MSLAISCPKCNISYDVDDKNVGDLHEHINICYRQLKCTNCSDKRFTKESELLEHFIAEHSESMRTTQPCPLCSKDYQQKKQRKPDSLQLKKKYERLPKRGDRVLAKCKENLWEYLPATIKRYHKSSMKYELKWNSDLNDECLADIADIAIDQVPDEKDLGVGSLILFRQGGYDTKQRGIKRWHKGVITNVLRSSNGSKMYHGHHTKDQEDGKTTNYKGYSHEFQNLTKYDFRLEPNVFDVLQSVKKPTKAHTADIFLSFDLTDSHQAVKQNLVNANEIPESYKTVGYENIYDPFDIKEFLEGKGFKVLAPRFDNDPNLIDVCSMIKNSTLFIGCLSDKYVSNKQCSMEFQYAKTSLRKPVIPIVVGNGSYQWISSVIGMLIAGELFIHYRNKDVAVTKNAELFTAVSHHIPRESLGKSEKSESSTAVIFLSYCWTNSWLAENSLQIKKATGGQFNDPRFLKSRLAERGYNVWLDIERLEAANNDAGLFGQIAKALKETKIFIPCISDEYANSNNCRMEFQFALKSLNKPVIPIVVGDKEGWKTSVIGALLSTQDKDLIDLHNVKTNDELDAKIEQMIEYIVDIESKSQQENLIQTPRILQSRTARLNVCKSKAIRRRSISSSDSQSEKDDSDSDSSSEEYFYTAGISNSIRSNHQVYKRAPEIGDQVVGHYNQHLFYFATVAGVDVETMTYSLIWDNDEQSYCVKPFDLVAIDAPPDLDDLSIGLTVFFPQGTYFCNVTKAERLSYHKGEVKLINRADMNNVMISGRHIENEEATFDFEDVSIDHIRLPPTALDFMFVATH